jgi:hypothetical protein
MHMTHAHCCIRLYVPVSRFPMLCILCICVCMSDIFNPHTCRYIQICTLRGSSYLHVSDCIFVRNTCTYALMHPVHICMYLSVFWSWIRADMHFCCLIHTHMHSCIQCISVCIYLYFDPGYKHICQCIRESNYCILLRRIGRPQAQKISRVVR